MSEERQGMYAIEYRDKRQVKILAERFDHPLDANLRIMVIADAVADRLGRSAQAPGNCSSGAPGDRNG